MEKTSEDGAKILIKKGKNKDKEKKNDWIDQKKTVYRPVHFTLFFFKTGKSQVSKK